MAMREVDGRMTVDDETMLWAADALERSSRTLSDDPTNTDALRDRAMARHFIAIRTGARHLYVSARLDYDEVLRQDPGDAASHANRGHAMACMGLVEDALGSFRRALELAPSAALYRVYGTYLHDLGRHLEAIPAFDEAIRLDPNSPDAHSWKGEALLRAGQPEPAIECLEKAASLSPEPAPARNRLAVALLEAKRHAEATKQLQYAISLDPNDATLRAIHHDSSPIAHNHYGHAAGHADDYPGSAEISGHMSTAQALLERRDGSGAVAEYRRALEFDPDNLELRLGMGLALLASNNLTDALGVFGQVTSIDRTSLMANFNRGRTLALLGRHEDARRAFEDATKLEPAGVRAQLNRSSAMYQIGSSADAIRICERAMKISPTNPEAYKLMAAILSSMGRYEEALSHIDKAIRLVPNDAVSHVHRGYILESLGRVSDALGAFYLAIRINPDMRNLAPRP